MQCWISNRIYCSYVSVIKLIHFGLVTVPPQTEMMYMKWVEKLGLYDTWHQRYRPVDLTITKWMYTHSVRLENFTQMTTSIFSHRTSLEFPISIAVMFWELLFQKRPYDGMARESYYKRVVHGDKRPPIPKKMPSVISDLLTECWR